MASFFRNLFQQQNGAATLSSSENKQSGLLISSSLEQGQDHTGSDNFILTEIRDFRLETT